SAGIAQQRHSLDEELRNIFERNEYRPETFGPAAWWEDGRRFTTIEPSAEAKGTQDIVAYDSATGKREVLISASALKITLSSTPYKIDDYSWSEDRTRLLLFTNSTKVWRDNTRGDYWVLDMSTKKLRQLGREAPSSTLMFAKFSPDGSRAAYVREN